MTTSILTCFGTNAKQIKPAVVNLFQNGNATDSIEFQIENYQQDNVNLSTLDPYVICHGAEFVGGLDEVKLTSEVTSDGILRVYWDLTIMSLSSPQTITAQLVFKSDEGAVGTSYKFIVFCNESLTADEEIVAKYPTILKQMERRIDDKTDEATQGAVDDITNTVSDQVNNALEQINQMAGAFDASVVYIPYGEHIPVENRVTNRLYYQYTNGEHTQGRFEDYMGNVLVAEGAGGGGGCGSSLPMFAPIWSDHLYNDASYLRADNFSWHNSAIYVTAYAKLLEQYNHENSVEMIDGDITYKLTPDGFRIADAGQHDDVRYAYENKGRAWYYLLDTANPRFKLPREKNESNKYLYFYVGNYERPATEVNIGILTELANGTDISVIVEEVNAEVDAIKTQAIAEIQSTGLGDLQAQVDALSERVVVLQTEMNTMMGRMDFANAVKFEAYKDKGYTCPSDGFVQFDHVNHAADTYYVLINDVVYCTYNAINCGTVGLIPVSTGDVISSNTASQYVHATFIPQKGV